MIKAGQIEKGTALLIKGQPFVCVDREFVNHWQRFRFRTLKAQEPFHWPGLRETMEIPRQR